MHFDQDGPWDLEVAGFEVPDITFGAYLVDIDAYGPEGATSKIRFEGPFELHQPDGERERIDPQTDPWERFIGLFALRHDTIRVARITRTSELCVKFASGRALTSSGEDGVDTWEMSAPGGVLVLAGTGRPAIYDGNPSRTRIIRWDGEFIEVDDPDVQS